eukprot:1490680-Amphidinium_carterae.1
MLFVQLSFDATLLHARWQKQLVDSATSPPNFAIRVLKAEKMQVQGRFDIGKDSAKHGNQASTRRRC